MVAATSTTPRISKNPSTPQSPIRPPLSPSEKTNHNADSISRKPRAKEIPSRYLQSPSHSTSASLSNRARPHATAAAAAAESPRILSLTTTTRSLSVSFQGESFSFQTTRLKPISQNPPKRPKARQNPLSKSLDSLSEKKGPVFAAVRVLGHSAAFDDKVKRASFDGEDIYLASDSDSSNSGSQEGNTNKGRATARGISVPARLWPESFTPAKKAMSPRMGCSIRPSSPSKLMGSPLKGQLGNVPSILSFAAEARRVKKGVSRIKEAHSLRLLYNRHLQWRYANAQAEAALSAQRVNTEKNLYNAWLSTSELRDSVRNKRIKIQLLLQCSKLTSILKGQITYVEEWSLMDNEHYTYLSGLIEALEASTLRLPVVGGARANIQELQNAVNTAVDVMQAMGTPICSLLSKVEGTRALVSELARAAAHERALMIQSEDLISNIAAMHVKQCSLQGQILQLSRNLNLRRL